MHFVVKLTTTDEPSIETIGRESRKTSHNHTSRRWGENQNRGHLVLYFRVSITRNLTTKDWAVGVTRGGEKRAASLVSWGGARSQKEKHKMDLLSTVIRRKG